MRKLRKIRDMLTVKEAVELLKANDDEVYNALASVAEKVTGKPEPDTAVVPVTPSGRGAVRRGPSRVDIRQGGAVVTSFHLPSRVTDLDELAHSSPTGGRTRLPPLGSSSRQVASAKYQPGLVASDSLMSMPEGKRAPVTTLDVNGSSATSDSIATAPKRSGEAKFGAVTVTQSPLAVGGPRCDVEVTKVEADSDFDDDEPDSVRDVQAQLGDDRVSGVWGDEAARAEFATSVRGVVEQKRTASLRSVRVVVCKPRWSLTPARPTHGVPTVQKRQPGRRRSRSQDSERRCCHRQQQAEGARASSWRCAGTYPQPVKCALRPPGLTFCAAPCDGDLWARHRKW